MNRVLPSLGRPVVAGLLVMLAAAGAWTESRANQNVGDADAVFEVHGKEFQFVPKVLKVTKGQKVTIVFTNDGVLAHNFAFEALGLKTETIQSHETARLSFRPDRTGSFKIRCLVPGHMEAGMQGRLIVVDPE